MGAACPHPEEVGWLWGLFPTWLRYPKAMLSHADHCPQMQPTLEHHVPRPAQGNPPACSPSGMVVALCPFF